jgi:hypothetical protein
MPSITSWTRLEPDSRDLELRQTLSARVFDPLWMLTRQWQVGEFQGEDVGSPAIARVRATNATLTRCHLGALPPNTALQAPPYNPLARPLEVMVEQRRMRPTGPDDLRMLTLAVEAGLHLLRMLELQPLSRSYRDGFTSRFGLRPPATAGGTGADTAVARYLATMAGRAPDGRRIEAALTEDGADTVASDPVVGVEDADRAEVKETLSRWLSWYRGLFAEPTADGVDPWIPDRMEYAVSVAARLSERPEDERTLSAVEYDGGRLDWSSFDVNAEVNMGTAADRAFGPLTETVIPAPVTFPGAPAARFWEMEDAAIQFGLLPAGPTDLAQLLMIEYVSSYGNDWFVLPLSLPVGSLTAIDSLVVTDTFGARTLLRPLGDRTLPRPHWSMWQLAYTRPADGEPIQVPATNLFFLAPALATTVEGAAVEEVLFMRDEMANLAWAIERRIESPLEHAVRSVDVPAAAPEPVEATTADRPARYLLASTVPEHWVPLLPMQEPAGRGRVAVRLRRGAVLQPDGSQRIHRATGDILNSAADLRLYDEEVPREGIRMERVRQLARWVDGSTWAWTAYRKQVGRGEGSSGLRFDNLKAE